MHILLSQQAVSTCLISTEDYVDSDVNYTHVQNLLGVDTSAPFVWDLQHSVELFATVRRVFFGTLSSMDQHPNIENYFDPALVRDFGNLPASILDTNPISAKYS